MNIGTSKVASQLSRGVTKKNMAKAVGGVFLGVVLAAGVTFLATNELPRALTFVCFSERAAKVYVAALAALEG